MSVVDVEVSAVEAAEIVGVVVVAADVVAVAAGVDVADVVVTTRKSGSQ